MTIYCKHCKKPFNREKVKAGVQEIKCAICNRLFPINAHVIIEVMK